MIHPEALFKKQLARLIKDNYIYRDSTGNICLFSDGTKLLSFLWGSYTVTDAEIFPPVSYYHIYNHPYELIDQLHERKYPPELTFKNGKIRSGFINNLIARLERFDVVGVQRTDQVTRDRVHSLLMIWDTVPTSIKYSLSDWISSDGTFSTDYVTARILTQSGTHTVERVNLSTVRLAHDSILNANNIDLYVKLHEITGTNSVTFEGSTFVLCDIEFAAFQRHYSQCSSCGTWGDNEEFVLGLCRNCTLDSPRELLGYNERATSFLSPLVGKSKYSSRLTGVELEYERKDNPLPETLYLLYRNLKDHAIFKRDGSLNQGIEICTRPASVNIHLEHFTKMFNDEDCMNQLEVHSTCGMHVHVDRRSLSSLTLGKMIQFMQASKNKSFISVVAEREENRFARLGTDHTVTSLHRGEISERYQGVNLQNQNTIELRIFKTPSNYLSFLKNMEFVDALSSFVLPCNSGIKDTNYGAFLKYVKENKSTYKELSKFIKEKIND